MPTQRAVVHKEKGAFEVRDDVPLPRLRDEYMLVKTKAVALNPTDWKKVIKATSPGAIAGCDYAGVVEQIGSKVTTAFKVGDRVAGLVRGGMFCPPSSSSRGKSFLTPYQPTPTSTKTALSPNT
jgi:NADPH:quinone reductase-like Zn-dependent oxidoreductase